MAEKAERILATKCSGDCLYLRIVGDDCEWASNGTYCAKDLKFKRIREGTCAKCKTPKYQGITRQEAIAKMAKALRKNLFKNEGPTQEIKEKGLEKAYDEYVDFCCAYIATAALNALLGKE